MKKLNLALASALITAGLATTLSAVSVEESVKLNEKDVCNVEKLGIDKVLANAKEYNEVAKKENVEFRRLGVDNTDLIASVEAAIASGAKDVNPVDFKGQPSKTKLATDYAAWRACAFGLSALQYKQEAKSTWRDAVPGDGFKY